MKRRSSRWLAGLVFVVLPVIGAACKLPSVVARATVDAAIPLPTEISRTADSRPAEVDDDAPEDPCAALFSGPHYDVDARDDRTKPRFGQPATLRGAASAVCGHSAGCSVVMLVPAGRDDQIGEEWFVGRVDSAAHTSYEASGCGVSVAYFLVVAREQKVARIQLLVETGETCMHWRDEQITVGPNLFIWRDSGYGSPVDAESYKVWERSHYSIELSTLRVNGCAPPPRVLRGALIPHPFG